MCVLPAKKKMYIYIYIYYVLVRKVVKLLLFGPSRSSNCIDGLLIEKDNIILTTFIEKNRMVLTKDKVKCILKCKLLINESHCRKSGKGKLIQKLKK